MAWWRKPFALAVAATTAVFMATAAVAGEPVVRTSADGAGPSHLFWLTGPPIATAGSDTIGVVDPLYAAIRFYRVERASAAGAPLTGRVEQLGACGLPVDFRPWRLHQTKTGVVLESMPDPGEAGHLATAAALRTQRYRIDRTVATSGYLTDVVRLETAGWDPAAKPCGKYDGPASPVREGQPYSARRGANHPARTIIITNRVGALTTRDPLIVRSPNDGLYRLVSATELEPAGTHRVVQITEALPSGDGVMRLRQSLLTYAGGEVVGTRRFDETLIRSKIGRRPMAVMPTGEVVVMGSVKAGSGEKIFALLSCGSLIGLNSGKKASVLPCLEDTGAASRNIIDAIAVPNPPSVSEPLAGPNRSTGDDKAIFDRTLLVRRAAWSVDTTNLPERCRVPAGCLVGPIGRQTKYVAIRGMRLTRGVYKQPAMAYAQTASPAVDVPAFVSRTRADWDASLRSLDDGASPTPGNLDDDFELDLGIDCSALVQLAWSDLARSRMSTYALQTAPPSYVCPHRLRDMNSLKPGDAVAINVSGASNHVVLLGAAFPLDGASDGWLVLESASACDGVCWSVYDPGFFSGWGLYRAAGRADFGCPLARPETAIATNPVPNGLEAWRAKVLNAGG